MDWLTKYGFILFGTWLALAFFLAVFFFLRRHSPADDKKVGLGWYFLLGPFAFIKWNARRTGKNNLLTKREVQGWLLVLALIFIIVLWKIVSKNFL